MNQLYGTVTIERKVEDFPQWRDMLNRHAHKNLFSSMENIVVPGITWGDVCLACAGKNLMDTLSYVNKVWNKSSYSPDAGKDKYWKSPYQFSQMGGCCEDYAIAKMLALKELGITNEMRMLLVERKGETHAVLAVDDGDKTWILDNVNSRIREHANYKCTLKVSIGDGGIFSHTYQDKAA